MIKEKGKKEKGRKNKKEEKKEEEKPKVAPVDLHEKVTVSFDTNAKSLKDLF